MDRIEEELGGEASVLRFEKSRRDGQVVTRELGATIHPVIIVFDACGNEVTRFFSVPNESEVVETVRAIESCEPGE